MTSASQVGLVYRQSSHSPIVNEYVCEGSAQSEGIGFVVSTYAVSIGHWSGPQAASASAAAAAVSARERSIMDIFSLPARRTQGTSTIFPNWARSARSSWARRASERGRTRSTTGRSLPASTHRSTRTRSPPVPMVEPRIESCR